MTEESINYGRRTPIEKVMEILSLTAKHRKVEITLSMSPVDDSMLLKGPAPEPVKITALELLRNGTPEQYIDLLEAKLRQAGVVMT